MSLWKHAARWDAPRVQLTLDEGGTPLIRSSRIAAGLGLRELWFKYEGANPTGSYKDRFAAAAVSLLVGRGGRLCVGTSSGNTGAALAAYCARAGLPCFLAISEAAPEGKVRQMAAYGARLFRLRGFGRDPEATQRIMQQLHALAAAHDAPLEISAFAFRPEGMAGVQTISFEIADALAGRTLHVFSPAGAGGLILAVARGFARAAETGWRGRAHVHCVQPAGNDTMATALRTGADRARSVKTETTISGLQVGEVLDGHAAIAACRRSGGQGYLVTDQRVREWQKRLACEEGILAEPAGAVAVAGLEVAIQAGEIWPEAPVVCLVTGSGFKEERSLGQLAEASSPGVGDFEEFAALVRRETGR